MPLDPNIILSSRPVELQNPMDVAGKAMTLRNLATTGQMNQMSLQQAQKEQSDRETLSRLYQQNLGPDGTINQQGMALGMARAGLGDQLPGYLQASSKARKEQTDSDSAALSFEQQKRTVVGNALGSLLSDPDLNHDKAFATLAQLSQRGIMTPEQGAQTARELPGDPTQLRQYLMQHAMQNQDLTQQIAARIAMAPKYNEQDRGAAINQGTVDPFSGTRTAGADIAKTMTPDQKAKVDLAKESGFNPDEGDLFGALAMRGVSLPAGLRSKAQMKATARSLIDRNPALSTDEIADKVATGQLTLAGDKKVLQTAATVAGKVKYAEQEINQLVPLIQEASAKVPRGQFVPWNKLRNYTDAQMSDPNLKQLKAYLTTMSNAYDLLAARGGTDVDKRKHNREMFDAADSPEALQAALDAVQTEANISEKAATISMAAPSRVTPSGRPAPGGARPSLDALLGTPK